ncbi:MAG: tRNA 4-thiouridine(8) synthase ThiI [Calditrichaceae bacterium]|nr:tRNA 4-thiouridine(8) synthase ThiI [Calditrichaceae bacterium]MBN2710034.1 tRNA 4-thiouridine(8) synthase ThiI [Calditrichaceae bacterium]RQV92134.1 MAG: tRNA 4-thiouridine(8) synthase ThiI [Calditrichota bacterium]
MNSVYICHYGEIGLKGKNSAVFEKQLVQNIKKTIQRTLPGSRPYIGVINRRIIIKFKDEIEEHKAVEAIENIFGIVNFSPARITPNSIQEIEAICIELLQKQNFNTFAIRAKRSNKNFPLTSNEINIKIGTAVVDRLHKKVDLTNPDVTVFIEVLDRYTHVMAERYAGAGGLPVGISGKALALFSGGIDSPVAAYFLLKRGAKCEFVHFHSFPYTNKQSQQKVEELATVLNKYQFQSKIHMIPFAESQEDIVLNCPDKFRIILYRRHMMRVAQKIARSNRMRAIVTGESLGQVASQTLMNIGAIEQAVTLPVLRPLIGMDKTEIIQVARNIGTFDISIQPHDDVCTRFMPERPEIHARLPEVLEAETKLDLQTMTLRDFKNAEIIDI